MRHLLRADVMLPPMPWFLAPFFQVVLAFLGIPPRHPVTTTPREAQRRFGYANPSQAHLELRAKQRERVLARGLAPDDQGIVESQPILGNIA
ncbi:hypothetical protein AB0I30_27870 [Nocardia tengchongensis]|uniref:hypothetical protein n=1 Tax=Nocardia tengchongensis TaxID=2055889 RepID=UPI0033F4EC7B